VESGVFAIRATGSSNDSFDVDNISIYKVEPTIGTEILPTPSFIKNPIYIDNGISQYIDYSQELETNVMDSTVIDGDLRVTGDVKTNGEFVGKNACTAWVNFDGTTTPPTIRDSYNVGSVIRTAAGFYDIYFEKHMYNPDYSIVGMNGDKDLYWNISNGADRSIDKFSIVTGYSSPATAANANSTCVMVQIFGGKN
jgi:hypothetical protein